MDMRWKKQTHLCHLEKKKGPRWWVVNAGLCKGTALGHNTKPLHFVSSVCWKPMGKSSSSEAEQQL